MDSALQTSSEISEYKDIQISAYKNCKATIYILLSINTHYALICPTKVQGEQNVIIKIHKGAKACITKMGK